MEMKGNTLAIVLLVVGLVVGGGVGYFAAPKEEVPGEIQIQEVEKIPLDGKTVQIGYIASETTGLETATPHVQQIMTPDYNAYAEALGYDVEFEYLIDDATGQAAVHLEKVQGFKAKDVNVFIGGGWSSQAQSALSYCNDNDMLMWSSSSTSPLLSLPDDNLMRMCPDDAIQAPAIAEMLRSHGIEAIIMIYRGDSWADGIRNFLVPNFEEGGGVIIDEIRYAQEATEFSSYLETAEQKAKDAVETYGAEHVAIEIIAFRESVTIATQAKDYPTIYSLYWFGSDGTALTQQHIDDAPEASDHLRFYSTLAAPTESSKYADLQARYETIVGQAYGYYTACTYDIGWILTQTILESQSTDALDLIPLQPTACFNSFGASGWNKLNENDDRAVDVYQIWCYKYDDMGTVKNTLAGQYDSPTNTITWYTDVIGYTPTPVG